MTTAAQGEQDDSADADAAESAVALPTFSHCHALMLVMRPTNDVTKHGQSHTRTCDPDEVGRAFESIGVPSWEHIAGGVTDSEALITSIEKWWAADEDSVIRQVISDGSDKIDPHLPAGSVLLGLPEGDTTYMPDLLNPGKAPTRKVHRPSDANPSPFAAVSKQGPALLAVLLYPIVHSSRARSILAVALSNSPDEAARIAREAVGQFCLSLSGSMRTESSSTWESFSTNTDAVGRLNNKIGRPQFVNVTVESESIKGFSASLSSISLTPTSLSATQFIDCRLDLTLPGDHTDLMAHVIRQLGPVEGYNLAAVVSETMQAVHHLEEVRGYRSGFDRDFGELGLSASGATSGVLERRRLRSLVDAAQLQLESARFVLSQLAINENDVIRSSAFVWADQAPTESVSPFVERARRARSDASLMLDAMEGRLEVKRYFVDMAQRDAGERLIQSEAGVTGLLAGVGASLAAFQIGGNRWWGIFAGLFLFAASIVWIGRDLPYKRIHLLPITAAGAALSAALTTSFTDPTWCALTLAVVIGAIAGYLVGGTLLTAWDGIGYAHDIRSRGMRLLVQTLAWPRKRLDAKLFSEWQSGESSIWSGKSAADSACSSSITPNDQRGLDNAQ